MEQLFEQFSKWQPEIEQLFQKNTDFQEICQDYEEVLSLLATWTAPANANPATIQGYRELLNSLEAEIMDCLQARFQHVGLSKPDRTPPTDRGAGKGGVNTEIPTG